MTWIKRSVINIYHRYSYKYDVLCVFITVLLKQHSVWSAVLENRFNVRKDKYVSRMCLSDADFLIRADSPLVHFPLWVQWLSVAPDDRKALQRLLFINSTTPWRAVITGITLITWVDRHQLRNMQKRESGIVNNNMYGCDRLHLSMLNESIFMLKI